jgi:hypothetical protein
MPPVHNFFCDVQVMAVRVFADAKPRGTAAARRARFIATSKLCVAESRNSSALL